MGDIAPFEWHRLFLFDEYHPSADIERITGLEYEGSLWGLFDHVPEHHDLLVFMRGDAVVCYELVNVPGISESGWRFGRSVFADEGIQREMADFEIRSDGRVAVLEL